MKKLLGVLTIIVIGCFAFAWTDPYSDISSGKYECVTEFSGYKEICILTVKNFGDGYPQVSFGAQCHEKDLYTHPSIYAPMIKNNKCKRLN